MRIRRILALFALLLSAGCGTKKETARYTAQSRQETTRQTEKVTEQRGTARSTMAYTEMAVSLLAPDSAGFQAIETIVCSRLDFIRQDSLETRTKEEEVVASAKQLSEEARKEEKRAAPGIPGFHTALLIGIACLTLYSLFKFRK